MLVDKRTAKTLASMIKSYEDGLVSAEEFIRAVAILKAELE